MAKKQRGARANKPNDSFGTINNDSLYKGKYRSDVYKEDEEENLETAEVKKETPAEETETFVSTEDQPHDYKKRYDDLKRHYDTKIKQHEERKNKFCYGNGKTKGVELPKTPEELEQFKTEYPDVYDVVQTIASMKAKEQSDELQKELDNKKQKKKI